MNIVFTDPPPRRGPHRHPWDDIAAQLRDHPGQWALCVRGIHSSYSGQINKGKIVAFRPAGAFEARSVRTDPPPKEGQQNDLYIRYVGTPDDRAAADDDA